MTTSFQKAGEKQLTVHVTVRDQNGNHNSYEYPVYVDVEEPNVKARFSTSTPPNQSGTTWVSLTNFGNAELSDVEVAAAAGGEEFDRNFLFDVAPGGEPDDDVRHGERLCRPGHVHGHLHGRGRPAHDPGDGHPAERQAGRRRDSPDQRRDDAHRVERHYRG